MSTHTFSSYVFGAGITLTANGTYLSPFTVTSAGTIQDGSGTSPAVYSAISDPTLVNDGSINSFVGIKLTSGATVVNNAILTGSGETYSGTIEYRGQPIPVPHDTGLIFVSGGAGTVFNNGEIHAFGGYGVLLEAGGYVSNSSAGYIYGFADGIVSTVASATVINAGEIAGGLIDTAMDGVVLHAGGTLTNEAGALIRGNLSSVVLFGTASVYNNGTIEDAGLSGLTVSSAILGENAVTIGNAGTIFVASNAGQGLRLFAGGMVSNTSASALILGAQAGIYTTTLSSALTVINDGTILATASGGAGIYLGGGGTVVNAGTISGPADAIDFAGTGANRLIVDAGAVFIGAVTASSVAINNLELAAETDASIGTLSAIGSQFTGFQSIAFDNTAAWLIDGNIAGLATGQTIAGFASTDTIILDGFTETSFSYVSGIGLELTGTGDGTTAATIDIAGSFSTGSFTVQNVAAGTEITEVTSGPVIGGAYTSPQAVTDGQGFAAFGNVTIGDAGASGPLTATITMTNAGAATDNDGTLTGAGLSKTATGTYTLTAASPADLQAALRAVVFTPAVVSVATNSQFVTGLTLQVSDGVGPAATDRNTVIYTLPGSQPLSLAFRPVPNAPNEFVSTTHSGETTYATTPITQTTDASSTTISAVLDGQLVYQQSFDAPYSDPAVQAAVAQADAILAGDGATAGAPVLASSQLTNHTLQTETVLTGETITSSTVSVNTYFGPGQLFGELDVNGTPNSFFTLAAGQTDVNSNIDVQQTIDQTVTTTTTQLTSQEYTITGTPESATCFAAGTKILTVNGPVAVQNLSIGDVLPTLHHGAQRIKWIGQRRYDGRFIAGNHLALPVHIKQNALADGIPSCDLIVSPGHGIFVDGVLIPAWRLINGASITQAERVDEIHYFHIELETHNIIFAHSCPAESFLDEAGLRGQFHNAAEFLQLYPAGAGSSTSCVPRVEAGEVLQRIQHRIAARAGIAPPPPRPAGAVRGAVDAIGPDSIYGWAQDIAAPEAPLLVDAWGEGKLIARGLANHYRADLRLAGMGSGCHGFEILLPPGYRGPVTIRHASTQLENGAFIVPVQQRIAPAIRGYVDAISPDTVYGWVQDIAAPEAALAVDLWSDGRLLARALANRYRPDLRRAGLGSGRHGFEIPIPPGTSGEVSIRHGATPLAQPELKAPSHSAAA